MKLLKLTEEEQLLSEQGLFFEWLLKGRVNFLDLTIQYNRYLEKLKFDNNIQLQSMAIPLTSYFQGYKEKEKQKIFYKAKSAYNLLKLGVYKGTPFEKELKDYVKKYKYSEENNLPNITYPKSK